MEAHETFRLNVLEQTNVVEKLISVQITKKYLKGLKDDYNHDVFYDEFFSSNQKLKILGKGFPKQIDSKICSKIERLFTIRDLFANEKITNGDGHDFKKLYGEFLELVKEVEPVLANLPSVKTY